MTTVIKIKYRVVKTILDIMIVCLVFFIGESFGVEETKWLEKNTGKTKSDFWDAVFNWEDKKEKEVEEETEPIEEKHKIGFCG